MALCLGTAVLIELPGLSLSDRNQIPKLARPIAAILFPTYTGLSISIQEYKLLHVPHL